jgi:hypothetical protein
MIASREHEHTTPSETNASTIMPGLAPLADKRIASGEAFWSWAEFPQGPSRRSQFEFSPSCDQVGNDCLVRLGADLVEPEVHARLRKISLDPDELLRSVRILCLNT